MESKGEDEDRGDRSGFEGITHLPSLDFTAPPCPSLNGLEFDLAPLPVKCQLLHPYTLIWIAYLGLFPAVLGLDYSHDEMTPGDVNVTTPFHLLLVSFEPLPVVFGPPLVVWLPPFADDALLLDTCESLLVPLPLPFVALRPLLAVFGPLSSVFAQLRLG